MPIVPILGRILLRVAATGAASLIRNRARNGGGGGGGGGGGKSDDCCCCKDGGGGQGGGGGGSGGGGNILSSLMGAVAGPLRSLFSGVIGFIQNGIQQVIGSIGALLSNGFQLMMGGLQTLMQGLASAIQSVVSALVQFGQSAIESASEFGKAALSLRSKTGMSYEKAGGLLTKGMAFGMSPSETAGAFGNQNPFIGKLLGNDPTSANYISGLASERSRYASQGPLGLMMWQNMANARGVSAEAQQLAAMDPGKVAAQEKWANDINGKLGMSGADIQLYAEDFQLAMQKVKTVLEMLKLKFASAIGPGLVAGFEKIATFLAENSDRITNVLTTVGNALSGVFMTGLNSVLGFLEANAGGIESAILGAFNWIMYEAPPMLLRAGAWIAQAGASILMGLSTVLGYVIQFAPFFAQVFNQITLAFINSLPTLLSVADFIINFFINLTNAIILVINGVISVINDAMVGLNYLIGTNIQPIQQIGMINHWSEMGNDQQLQDQIAGMAQGINQGVTDMTNSIVQNGPEWQRGLENGATMLTETSGKFQSGADNYMKEIAANTRTTADKTKENVDATKEGNSSITNAFNVWGQSMLNAGRDAAYAVVE